MHQRGEPWAFISYANRPDEHKRSVRAFAQRLRASGIRCVTDEEIETTGPAEGHARWSREQIQHAPFVLVVCSAEYGAGRGSEWEWALIEGEMYRDRARNYRFIPVLLAPEDEQYVPAPLGVFNRYCVADPAGYERLVRHLRSGPRGPAAPAGAAQSARRGAASAAAEAAPWEVRARDTGMLLSLPDRRYAIAHAEHVRGREGGEVEARVRVQRQADLGFFRTLSGQADRPIDLAYGDEAFRYRLQAVRDEGGGTWTLALRDDEALRIPVAEPRRPRRHSPDDVAARRARRILLDEGIDAAEADHEVLDDLIREEAPGALAVPPGSPLPALYAGWQGSRDEFLRAARLVAVHHLVLSGTVEHVLALELTWAGEGRLAVRFHGQRARRFGQSHPAQIHVAGECLLG